MDIKNEVLVRVYILLFGVVMPIAVVLLGRTYVIGIKNQDKWRTQGEEHSKVLTKIEADRGDIYAADGSVLATSIPYYDIYFDALTSSEEDFMNNLDTLAYCLATFVDKSYTVGGYRQQLLDWRRDSVQYALIKRKVTYSLKQQMANFPLFNLGRYRGGFIDERKQERRQPFGVLASRSIGYVSNMGHKIGLEGYFDDILSGEPGSQMMIKVDPKRNILKPVEDLLSIDPESGDDIKTTIDINLQDIVHDALYKAMNNHEAEWGTAVLMEVKTGQIKAIANLEKPRNREVARYGEIYNHAVGSAVEPGSTFKTASMLALLEDGFIENLEDSIFINRGAWEYYGVRLPDSSPESSLYDSISIRKAFEISSNVGMSRLVTQAYGVRNKENKNLGAELFIKHLKEDFNLHLPTGIKILGEGIPLIKDAFSEEQQWSGLTLPWMSIGYESELTPIQILTFYNAIANEGQMMKPYLVTEVQRFREVKQIFKPTVIKKQIAKKSSIATIKELLRGVVEEGTARKLKTSEYNFAGKTGTAQVKYARRNEKVSIEGYRASFVGYFPAEEPLFSCIVVINKPRKNGVYGGEVAGPVFREIADNCFRYQLQLHETLVSIPANAVRGRKLPSFDIGNQQDMKTVLDYFELPYEGQPDAEIAVIRTEGDSLLFENRTLPEEVVPAVTGMGLKDALFVLENRGLKVKVEGLGKVSRQSLKPGTAIRGQEITLYLK